MKHEYTVNKIGHIISETGYYWTDCNITHYIVHVSATDRRTITPRDQTLFFT